MKAYKKSVLAAGIALFMIFMMAAPALAGQVTVTGTVSDDYQIVDNQGQSYDIAESAKGEELVAQASGKTVEVTGTLEEEAGMKTIVVESFKILQE